MTTGKSLRRVEATGPMVARAVAMEEAVTVAAELAWWVARAAARAAGRGGSDDVERMDRKGRLNVPGYGEEWWRGEEQACKLKGSSPSVLCSF